jgi:hypothetical protein
MEIPSSTLRVLVRAPSATAVRCLRCRLIKKLKLSYHRREPLVWMAASKREKQPSGSQSTDEDACRDEYAVGGKTAHLPVQKFAIVAIHFVLSQPTLEARVTYHGSSRMSRKVKVPLQKGGKPRVECRGFPTSPFVNPVSRARCQRPFLPDPWQCRNAPEFSPRTVHACR